MAVKRESHRRECEGHHCGSSLPPCPPPLTAWWGSCCDHLVEQGTSQTPDCSLPISAQQSAVRSLPPSWRRGRCEGGQSRKACGHLAFSYACSFPQGLLRATTYSPWADSDTEDPGGIGGGDRKQSSCCQGSAAAIWLSLSKQWLKLPREEKQGTSSSPCEQFCGSSLGGDALEAGGGGQQPPLTPGPRGLAKAPAAPLRASSARASGSKDGKWD